MLSVKHIISVCVFAQFGYNGEMNTENQAFKTPGQLILSLLEKRGWSQRALAIVLGMDETAVNRVCSDKRPVDAKLALALEDVFGVPADKFLELQRSYELAQARIVAMPDPARADRAQLYGDLPITEMIKRGWIEAKDIRDPKVSIELMRFFGVNRLEDIEILPHAAKKTAVNTDATPAQLAWLYRVRSIASEMLAPPYSESALRNGLTKLKPLMTAPEEARKAPRVLLECGVRFVIVESLPSAKIDGVCFWLDEHSPVVGMSMRHDRIDNFWFVLRHELEHVLQNHGRENVMLDTDMKGEIENADIPEEERVANAAASDFCVPREKLDAFIARKAPYFSERDLIGFSRILGVHPGIVAGQIQHRTEKYGQFRQHLAKIRSCVCPTAVVDGWGDIYPLGA